MHGNIIERATLSYSLNALNFCTLQPLFALDAYDTI